MQKRFCSCGHMVLVTYRCEKGVWRPKVFTRGLARRTDTTGLCPVCGNALNIHTLR